MRKKYDIVALGEVLVDFTPAGTSEQGMRLFEQNPGGAPANMLAAAAQFGLKTAFVGKVGNDMHGEFLKKTLDKASIDTKGLLVDDEVFTTMAFVSLNDAGERQFAFARKPGADTKICIKEIDKDIISRTKVFHVGSLSLTDEPARTTTYEAVKYAKDGGVIISYDPNYRASLWMDKETAVVRMQSMIPYVDIMKMSDEETDLLTPYKNPKDAINYLLQKGIKVVAVTLGKDGAVIGNRQGIINVEGFHAKTVDTTGAGDSFWGGFVSMFILSDKELDLLTKTDLESFGKTGNAVASLCVERRGGFASIPKYSEIEERLKENF